LSLVASSLKDGVDDISTEEDAPPGSHQSDSSVCSSVALDATLGMQELEDAVAEDQWRSRENWQGFSHTITIGGAMMKKSRAIA